MAKWIKTIATEEVTTAARLDLEESLIQKITPLGKDRDALIYFVCKRLRMMAMDEWYRRKNTQPPRMARIARASRRGDKFTLYWDFIHG